MVDSRNIHVHHGRSALETKDYQSSAPGFAHDELEDWLGNGEGSHWAWGSTHTGFCDDTEGPIDPLPTQTREFIEESVFELSLGKMNRNLICGEGEGQPESGETGCVKIQRNAKWPCISLLGTVFDINQTDHITELRLH